MTSKDHWTSGICKPRRHDSIFCRNQGDFQPHQVVYWCLESIWWPNPHHRRDHALFKRTFLSLWSLSSLSNHRRLLEKPSAVICQTLHHSRNSWKPIKWMKPGRAPSSDNIPWSFSTHGEYGLRTKLFYLILRIWRPRPSRMASKMQTSLHLQERKLLVYDNYWSISLLCIVSKIFTRILLDRLLDIVEEVLPVWLLT